MCSDRISKIQRPHVQIGLIASLLIVGFIDAERDSLEQDLSNKMIQDQMVKAGHHVINLTLADNIEDLSADYFIHELDKHPTSKANAAQANLLGNYIKRYLGAIANQDPKAL